MATELVPDADAPVPLEPNRLAAQIVAQIRSESFYAGPLPPPQMLAGYEKLIPGSANRILVLVELQSEHRQSLESRNLDHDHQRATMGSCFGLIVALAALFISMILVLDGHEVPGSIIGSGSLAALVGVFVYGRESQRRERTVKNEAMTKALSSNPPPPS